MNIEEADPILEELITLQRKKLIKLAQELGVKNVSLDDVLSPYDFPQLIKSPRFNFEDGLLAGLISAQMALRNKKEEA